MTTNKIIDTRDKIERVYSLINSFVSNNSFLDMLDLAYPNHDGQEDADVTSEMMLLRDSANGLSQVCNILVNKLTDVIGDE